MPFSDGQLHDVRPHEVGELVEAPLAELLGEVDLHDVALEADADPVLAVAAELVDRRRVDLVALGLAHRQDLGDAAGSDVLLGDDESHRAPVHSIGGKTS